MGTSAQYSGEKIHSLGENKFSAKGVPKQYHSELDYNSLNFDTRLVYNLIRPDKTFGMVTDHVVKSFQSSVIPRKRYFIDCNYSIAFD